MRETDPQQSPLRRGVGAIFGGLMIAILVAAGFGIYGIVTKAGSDRWQADGAVVIEKETGASFIYRQGKLHPTLNYASAVLASGRPDAPVFRVPGNSLASTPRGVTIGIPGAPNSLAPASKHIGLPWTICSAPSGDDTGRTVETVSLVVSRAPVGGRSLAEEGVLIRDARNVVPALFGEVNAAPVGPAWLDALPAGNAIERVAFSGRNQPSSEVDGWAIGEVLVAQTGSGPQHYLVLDDGLAPITELQRRILRAEFTVAGRDTCVPGYGGTDQQPGAASGRRQRAARVAARDAARADPTGNRRHAVRGHQRRTHRTDDHLCRRYGGRPRRGRTDRLGHPRRCDPRRLCAGAAGPGRRRAGFRRADRRYRPVLRRH